MITVCVPGATDSVVLGTQTVIMEGQQVAVRSCPGWLNSRRTL